MAAITFVFVVYFAPEAQAQIINCPPTLNLDCSQAVPTPDPSVVSVVSYCKDGNCCSGGIVAGDFCTANLDGCMKVALTCIDVTESCEAVYRFKVYNTCQNALSNIAFTIPAGATGTWPTAGMSYTDPCGIDNWNVETPNGGPDAGTLKFEGQLEQGESTCFEMKFLGLEKLPGHIDVNPKYGPNEYYVSLSTYGCGNASVLNKIHKVDKLRPMGCVGLGICRIYRVKFDCPLVVSGRTNCEQGIIKGDDTTAPSWDVTPVDKVISCSEGIVFDTPTATDDCGVVTIVDLGSFVTGGCPGKTYHIKRWKAEDECGNQSGAVQQVITVPADCCPSANGGLNELSLEDEGTLNLSSFEMTVAPNPTRGQFQIDLDGLAEQATEVAIFDLSGKVIFTKEITAAASARLMVNPAELGMTTGVYLVKVISSDQVQTQKVLVQQ
ncbi:MAG: T9SS type A sorting domain-containing protein [Phaeodactylibacter sp.]|nr:T9SS type A sorting domain-containing protein [Phaeodactylibacter sp.]